MGVGTFFHYFGTVLLLAATALLIVVSVTAPVVNDLSILKVDVSGSSTIDRITFGTFGYCIIRDGPDDCTKAHVGYDATAALAGVQGLTFSKGDRDSARVLTRVLILHPIAAGLTFLAFLLCLGTSFLGSFVASLFSFLAFLVTVVAMACDFAGFSIIKHAVNTRGPNNLHARWGPTVWCILVAAALNLIATVLVFITCCAGRRKKTHTHRGKADY
ncbi:SUR7/PalI family domain-containing protein [Trichoderma breve]|uniref:SUR7/PalI family domain-containing protein n=1 Tax=Trichoderma breve TaxID=2034170 RepID=A0A9W9JQS9_9HYPO|nr:SUR7/PalI family domain-containing protein [Trichoderma breve]KAJ4864121.1 SUR7/PalI family domain-containing protein [Trichoderma breve]